MRQKKFTVNNFSNRYPVPIFGLTLLSVVFAYSAYAQIIDDEGLPIAPNNAANDASLHEDFYTGSSPTPSPTASDDPTGQVQNPGIFAPTAVPGANDYDHTYDRDLGTPIVQGYGDPGGLGDPLGGQYGSGGGRTGAPPDNTTGGGLTGAPAPSYSGGGSDKTFTNPLGNTTTIQAFISKILGIVVQIAIPIAIFFIVYAGFLLTTARGNEEQLKRGKSALLYALIGSAVILAAQLLSEVIKNTINNL